MLRENRIEFNQNMIETVFEPGEILRFFNHVVHRVGETDEIASKFKLKNRKYEVVSRKGTVYEPRGAWLAGACRAAVLNHPCEGRIARSSAPVGALLCQRAPRRQSASHSFATRAAHSRHSARVVTPASGHPPFPAPGGGGILCRPAAATPSCWRTAVCSAPSRAPEGEIARNAGCASASARK